MQQGAQAGTGQCLRQGSRLMSEVVCGHHTYPWCSWCSWCSRGSWGPHTARWNHSRRCNSRCRGSRRCDPRRCGSRRCDPGRCDPRCCRPGRCSSRRCDPSCGIWGCGTRRSDCPRNSTRRLLRCDWCNHRWGDSCRRGWWRWGLTHGWQLKWWCTEGP